MVSAALIATAASGQVVCVYGDAKFTEGATFCQCPSIGSSGNAHDQFVVQSQKGKCTKEGVADSGLCVSVTFKDDEEGKRAFRFYSQLVARFCK